MLTRRRGSEHATTSGRISEVIQENASRVSDPVNINVFVAAYFQIQWRSKKYILPRFSFHHSFFEIDHQIIHHILLLLTLESALRAAAVSIGWPCLAECLQEAEARRTLASPHSAPAEEEQSGYCCYLQPAEAVAEETCCCSIGRPLLYTLFLQTRIRIINNNIVSHASHTIVKYGRPPTLSPVQLSCRRSLSPLATQFACSRARYLPSVITGRCDILIRTPPRFQANHSQSLLVDW